MWPLKAQPGMLTTVGIYVHIPFCRSRCGYCDFNTYAGFQGLMPSYVRALVMDIHHWQDAGFAGRTLYIGGGTPSLLPVESVGAILTAVREVFALSEQGEITVEANPGTVCEEYLRELRALGVNRLSVGAQSFDEEDLAVLDREHHPDDVEQAIAAAHRAGFENINLDLMYGVPGQTLESWRRTLGHALALHPTHLSLYALTIEEGTPLARRVAMGHVAAPDDDLTAEQYELAEEVLELAGFAHYEISNWAQRTPQDREIPALAARHNLIYWQNQPYVGFGAGAHSFLGGLRMRVVSWPPAYIHAIEGGYSPIVSQESIDRQMAMAETLFLGLRLVERGVLYEEFAERFGLSLQEAYGPIVDDLVQRGLLEVLPDRVRLTRRGRFVSNEVFVRFLPMREYT
jgi:oxygen-independent coproporphyrinogen-3 oxidase